MLPTPKRNARRSHTRDEPLFHLHAEARARVCSGVYVSACPSVSEIDMIDAEMGLAGKDHLAGEAGDDTGCIN